MVHYKRDAVSNRNALFGSSSGGGGNTTSNASSSKPSVAPRVTTARPTAMASTAPRSAVQAAVPTAAIATKNDSNNSSKNEAIDNSLTPGPSTIFAPASGRRTSTSPLNLLTGAAKLDKMAEAESFRALAKKAMTKSLFSRPDPIIAANYYKRAADAYAQCGEIRLEKLHRIACGDCQLGQESYASAAVEYTRAAELAEEGSGDDSLDRKRKECHKLHIDAANAYAQLGERGRCAESTMKGAFGLVMGSPKKAQIEDKALVAVEGAVESFAGDPLNRKRDYRRTGVSVYRTDDDNNIDGASYKAVYELARQQAVTDAYAHETLYKVSSQFIVRRQFESALYAHGAGTAILELEGYATVSLYRAYLSETILLLAMGDSVAASREFKAVHLQNTSYLSSRECAFEEDLIRAVEAIDGEALDVARSKESGPHRSAMANLDPIMRELIMNIQVSGRAKREKKQVTVLPTSSVAALDAANTLSKEIHARDDRASNSTSSAEDAATRRRPLPSELTDSALVRDTNACFEEMDDIMNQMGLNDDDYDEDDQFDLR